MNAADAISPATRLAILSMDVEDWYHLDYFQQAQCDRSYSLLDGLDRYLELLAEHQVPSSFFVLGDIAANVVWPLRDAMSHGHDVSCHGWDHCRPLTLEPSQFRQDLLRSRGVLADLLGASPPGYRAPCFSLDRPRLEIVRELGFHYDSSRIQFSRHPLYGTLDMAGFDQVRPWVFRSGDFFEFEVSTLKVRGRDVPVSGGGYIRLLPWWLMGRLMHRYLARESFYVLYIHPFELSSRADPPLPRGTGFKTRFRLSHGRSKVVGRLAQTIQLLRSQGFAFTTFARLRQELLAAKETPPCPASS